MSATTLYGGAETGAELLPVNKYHDYFTSCLPDPQKGDGIKLPLFNNPNGGNLIPVRTDAQEHLQGNNHEPLRFLTSYGQRPATSALSQYDGKLATSSSSSGSEGQELAPSNL